MNAHKIASFAFAASVAWNVAEAAPAVTTGKVTWYGEGYRGKRMANGHRYNPDAMTCATWEHPLGSRLKVTNTATGRSVVVTVTDRGPAFAGRKLDLSRAAFAAIAQLRLGVIQCEICRVEGER